MMVLHMDKSTSTSSRERVQSLLEQTVELEHKRRKDAQARIPSDLNVWQQIRENYEAIILEDHTFSEKHYIEYTLWQLHYKRIEEFKAHFSALASSGSNAVQNAKGLARPDRIAKIRLQFKTFLSEATGFYHDLILKIKSKYGLPLGSFVEDSEYKTFVGKNGKKSSEIKKGLVSCHRCLIYLGDLARYKGIHGEGDSRNREYDAATSYYVHAASLLPASGNPHHQLGIVASYSGDEFAAIYCYFRSLAVESPFPTALDNLIVSFEKNRQNYSRLLSVVTAKERGKGKDPKLKDTNLLAGTEKDKAPSAHDKLKEFCTTFVRLNGILFTRTSLDMSSEVLNSAISALQELLSSGPEEVLNFGAEATDNALFIIRLVAILIFSVHNVKKEKGQTYAEIVQRAMLAQKSLTASFELLGRVLDRCVQLEDPLSSYLLPGVLVFVEWLVCCSDTVLGCDLNERQTAVRSNFWNQCIAFFNRILLLGPMFIDDEEEDSCFSNMRKYDERETENRRALLEDYELRGFVPLLPAQNILDFSRKYSFVSEGPKEKKSRIKRILAAAKALTGVMKIAENLVYFDSSKKKFVVGVKSSDDVLSDSQSSPPEVDQNSSLMQQGQQPYLDEDDEEEVIVFNPMATDMRKDAHVQIYSTNGGLSKPDQGDPVRNSKISGDSCNNVSMSFQLPVSAVGSNLLVHPGLVQSQGPHLQQTALQQASHLQPAKSQGCKWSAEDAASLTGSLTGLSLMGNGNMVKTEMQGNYDLSYYPMHSSPPIHMSLNANGMSVMPYSQSRGPEAVLPPKVDAVSSSGFIADGMGVQTSLTRKSPISRPVRHIGPPPGFNPVPSKVTKEPLSSLYLSGNRPLTDNYSWLDGYQPQSIQGVGLTSSMNYLTEYTSTSNGLNGTVNFPLTGKQVPMPQAQMGIQKDWQTYQQQQPVNRNLLSAQLHEQYQGMSSWPSH